MSEVSEDRAVEQREILRAIPLFGDLDHERLEQVQASCRTRRIAAGEWCVRAGEPSDALYIVVYGRLQTYVNGRPGDEISRGQVFGELGLITGRPRAADVRAIRDSELLVLPAQDFDRMADEHPSWMRHAAQIVVDRLVEQNRGTPEDQVLTLALFSLGKEPRHELALALAAALGRGGETAVVSEHDAPPLSDRARWAHHLESKHRFVIYDGSSGDEAWNAWCWSHSDRLAVVTNSDAQREVIPPSLADDLTERVAAGTVSLLVVHQSWTRRPRAKSTLAALLEAVPILNIRDGQASDVARAARLLVGQGCGLVLGGGGPRGFAHLGVMRALDEAGIPVDAVGGTSIGAVMGSFRALDLDADTREAWALDGFVESGNLFTPTLPVLSFSSARKVRNLLESSQYLGDRMIEETWLPFFCVSANLTRAEVVVHDRGSLATAVRASLSLPGIFPPVRSGPDLLVDGGVLNNLPVDVMRDHVKTRSVLAVDLAVEEELGAPASYRETPSGWALLLGRIMRSNEIDATPLSLNVLMRAKELAGIRAQRQILAERPPDVLIRPDVSDATMFDFKKAKHLIDVGYRETMARFEAGDFDAVIDEPLGLEGLV